MLADIAIFEEEKMPLRAADKHHASVAPKIQVEVDADTENFESPDSYIYIKTDKLLAFGVEKVIWVMSDSKKILIATQDRNWEVINWHKDIEIMDGIMFNIGQYLLEGGSPFA